MAKFTDRLKEMRTQKKLTQQDLANIVGVNRVTYTNWENGKREPELDKVVELATALNSSLDYLLGKTDKNVLDLTSGQIAQLNTDEAIQIQTGLMQDVDSILKIAQEKFGIPDEDMEFMKYAVIRNFLETTE